MMYQFMPVMRFCRKPPDISGDISQMKYLQEIFEEKMLIRDLRANFPQLYFQFMLILTNYF